MFALHLLLAAGSLSTLVAGVPIPYHYRKRAAAPAAPLVERAADSYRIFAGDGSPGTGWPTETSWIKSFDQMFENNRALISGSCVHLRTSPPNNSEQETNDVKKAIQEVAQSSGVDARYVLAIVIQESKGCVRAPTTNNGVENPGLMQSFYGVGTCNPTGNPQDFKVPCPYDSIKQMIVDGVVGKSGVGLAPLIAASGSGVSKYYIAARKYNSGSVHASGNLGQGIATHCYSSDIANRLTGWVTATSRCDDGSIGNIAISESGGSGNQANEGENTPPPVIPPPVTPPPVIPPPVQGNTGNEAPPPPPQTPNPEVPEGVKWSGASSACKKWYKVQENDVCNAVAQRNNIDFNTLKSLNSGLDDNCSNLWLGYVYCVGA